MRGFAPLRRTLPVALAVIAIFSALMLSAHLTQVHVAESPQRSDDQSLAQVTCKGPWNGKQLSQKDLDGVIAKHEAWLKNADADHVKLNSANRGPYGGISAQKTEYSSAQEGYASPLPPSVTGPSFAYSERGRADLCGARIYKLDFKEADLRFARLMGARIEFSNIGGVDLRWASLELLGLRGAFQKSQTRPGTLSSADLTSALIYESDLSNFDFSNANLSLIDTNDVNLSHADFSKSTLAGATLRGIDFTDSELADTDISGAIVNIKSGHLPEVYSLRDAKGLNSISSYGGQEGSLLEIKQKLDSAGLRVPASEINYAINRNRSTNENKIKTNRSYLFQSKTNQLLFGITYAYGLKPERLLLSAFMISLFLWPIYGFCIYRSRRDSNDAIRRIHLKYSLASPMLEKMVMIAPSFHNAIVYGAWFTLLSAFRIGWGNWNVGDWIARLQPNPYDLNAIGWPRTVSGMQSLISVYFLVLAISRYFL